MKPQYYDLHTHTTCSDSTCSPKELLEKATKLGLSAISITDHETMKAYDILEQNKNYGFSIPVIPGIELRTYCCSTIIEILGLGIQKEIMNQYLEILNYPTKSQENDFIIQECNEKYRRIGLKLSEDFIENFKTSKLWPSRYIMQELLKVPENIKIIGEDIAQNPNSFYRHALTNPNSPLFIDMTPLFPSPELVIHAISKSQGKSILAHFAQYEQKFTIFEKMLPLCDGAEAFYPTFTKEDTQYVLEQTSFVSGGSDYHGQNKPKIHLGTGYGNLHIKREDISFLLDSLL